METKKLEQGFKIKEIDDNKIIYQRVLSTKNKTSRKKINELRRREDKLPTTTIHSFSIEEFELLKKIELELQKKIRNDFDYISKHGYSLERNKKKSLNTRIFELIIKFLEV